ncbi:MAG: hypothetical protein Q4D96_14015 [Propionibacteriaceae bacterium]|nr:hypothetical protein [Propionibacteriaceae bacterium]
MSAFSPSNYLATCLDESCELCGYPETSTLHHLRRGPVATYCRNCGGSSGDTGTAVEWLLATGGPLRPGCGPEWRDGEDVA